MYKFNLDPAKKQLIITCEGMFTVDIATKYLQELQSKIKTINTAEYTLVLDGREQRPSPQEVWPLQEQALKLYCDTPFKGKFNMEMESLVTKNQIKRIGKTDFEKQFTFISSFDQVK